MRSTRPRSKILIGDSAASIRCTGDSALFYKKIFPTSDEKYLIIDDGKKMDTKFFRCIDAVVHCAEDVVVTLRNVAFVPGVPFDLYSFNMIQQEHAITLDPTKGRTCSMGACFSAYYRTLLSIIRFARFCSSYIYIDVFFVDLPPNCI